jgi:putative superfamily III holin-X
MAEESLWETRLVRAVTDLGADLADLVQKELRLARTEIVQKLTLGLQAGAWFAITAALGFFAVVLILEALVFGIAANRPQGRWPACHDRHRHSGIGVPVCWSPSCCLFWQRSRSFTPVARAART